MPEPISVVSDSQFPSLDRIEKLVSRVGQSGLRSTGSVAHESLIDWVVAELHAIPDLSLREERDEIIAWVPDDLDFPEHGTLEIHGAGHRARMAIAGVVPYSRGGETATGELLFLPRNEPIDDRARGRVVIREFPSTPTSYAAMMAVALHATEDIAERNGNLYDRPSMADDILHGDLLAASAAGAVGMVIAFDLPRKQVAGYFEPHKGTHYGIPAVFIGKAEAAQLRSSGPGTVVSLRVDAHQETRTTRNIIATLPGASAERIVVVTHTDGNTWVQDNGVAALIALAEYFAAVPASQRPRTLEFVFATAHLHISREGSARFGRQLDRDYDQGSVAAVVAVEHLGTRELEAVSAAEGGRELVFSGSPEPMLWAVGPSDGLRSAVLEAVSNRNLDGVAVMHGLGVPDTEKVPMFGSFGGIGTHFHQKLIPTTAIISGPWSLWAPHFGAAAIDMHRLREQALALGDVISQLSAADSATIAGDYPLLRRARARGAETWPDLHPPEIAPTPTVHHPGTTTEAF